MDVPEVKGGNSEKGNFKIVGLGSTFTKRKLAAQEGGSKRRNEKEYGIHQSRAQ